MPCPRMPFSAFSVAPAEAAGQWRLKRNGPARSYWLVKTEPDCFSIHDLAASRDQTTSWSGVRNYQARNFMREMRVGDGVLFYHSSADPPAVAGTAVVAREAYPDPTAWNPTDDHFDPKASPQNPIWQMVDIRLERIFGHPVPIGTLREVPTLKHMELLRQGSRLSVQPVRPREFEIVVDLANAAAKAPRSKSAGPTKKKAASRARSKSAKRSKTT